MSEATTLSKLGEFLGIISRALVSSTYLMRSRQSDSSLFVITVKRITPSLVPWGTPPFSVNQSDRVLPILTACFRDVKNAAIKIKGLDELQDLPVLASILNDQLNQTP